MPLKIGGRYIAEGSYGCVFGEPPLKCKDDDKRLDDEYVSKLMLDSDLNDEMTVAQYWKRIDPDNKFSITPYRVCYLDKNSIREEDNLHKCRINKDGYLKNNGNLLFYKNGGLDLHLLPVKAKNYREIFSGFQNIWDGLVTAHSKNIFHLDIKPPNILKGYGEQIHLRLIDFGLSVNSELINRYEDIITRNETYYAFWPFEFGCFDEMGSLNSKATIKSRFDYWNSKRSSDGTSYGVSEYKFPFEKMYSALKESEHIFKNPKKLFEKADVYALGITLMQMLRTYFSCGIIMDDNGVNQAYYYDKKKDKYSTYLKLKEKNFLSEKESDYHLYLYNNVIRPLMNLINKCVSFDPNNRYSSKEAADEYKKLVPNFEEHLKTNDIKKYLSSSNILNKAIESPLIPTPAVNTKRRFKLRNILTKKSVKKNESVKSTTEKKFTLRNILSKKKNSFYVSP